MREYIDQKLKDAVESRDCYTSYERGLDSVVLDGTFTLDDIIRMGEVLNAFKKLRED